MENHSVVHRLRRKVRTRRLMRRMLPFVASLFLATPLASPMRTSAHGYASRAVKMNMPSARQLELTLFDQGARGLYDELGVASSGLRFEVFKQAYTGFLNLKAEGQIAHDRLTVIDFEKPSTEKRLWVLDLDTKEILFNTLVAHGHNSGENVATNFSNENESNMSSLGFYVTQDEYVGKHGRSLKLEGVDEGYNDNALARSVVMHGAEYVSEEFIRQYGRLGRSLGCPSLPMDQYAQIIDNVGGGSCLFLHGPDEDYSSRYLDQEAAAHEFAANVTSAATHTV